MANRRFVRVLIVVDGAAAAERPPGAGGLEAARLVDEEILHGFRFGLTRCREKRLGRAGSATAR